MFKAVSSEKMLNGRLGSPRHTLVSKDTWGGQDELRVHKLWGVKLEGNMGVTEENILWKLVAYLK